MREIKFRAYIKKLGWMVPVERINFDCETVEVDLTNGNGDIAEYDFDEVELMQYTGLKDKNGVEIYEGDVVKCRWLAELGITEIDCEAVGIVNWQDEICMFYIGFAKPFITHPCEVGRYDEDGMALEKTVDGFTKNDFSIDYEVIGNIYENPELLEN